MTVFRKIVLAIVQILGNRQAQILLLEIAERIAKRTKNTEDDEIVARLKKRILG